MKVIRINDELHNKLKEHADYDRRTINQEAETILELYFADAEDGLTSEQVARKRLIEAQEAKAHIVKEGKELGLLPETPPSPKNTDVSGLIVGDLPKPPEAEYHPSKARSKGDILADIRKLEADRDEELRYNQDPVQALTIDREYRQRIGPLWAEYHALKEAE